MRADLAKDWHRVHDDHLGGIAGSREGRCNGLNGCLGAALLAMLWKLSILERALAEMAATSLRHTFHSRFKAPAPQPPEADGTRHRVEHERVLQIRQAHELGSNRLGIDT